MIRYEIDVALFSAAAARQRLMARRPAGAVRADASSPRRRSCRSWPKNRHDARSGQIDPIRWSGQGPLKYQGRSACSLALTTGQRLLDCAPKYSLSALPQRAGLARLCAARPELNHCQGPPHMRLERLEISGFKSFSDRVGTLVRSRRDGDRRPERVRQEQRRRRPDLGHGRTEREEPARREDGRRHLQRLGRAQADRRRRGAAPVQRRRHGADRAARHSTATSQPTAHGTTAMATATATATAMATATGTRTSRASTCSTRFARSRSRAGCIDRAKANT